MTTTPDTQDNASAPVEERFHYFFSAQESFAFDWSKNPDRAPPAPILLIPFKADYSMLLSTLCNELAVNDNPWLFPWADGDRKVYPVALKEMPDYVATTVQATVAPYVVNYKAKLAAGGTYAYLNNQAVFMHANVLWPATTDVWASFLGNFNVPRLGVIILASKEDQDAANAYLRDVTTVVRALNLTALDARAIVLTADGLEALENPAGITKTEMSLITKPVLEAVYRNIVEGSTWWHTGLHGPVFGVADASDADLEDAGDFEPQED